MVSDDDSLSRKSPRDPTWDADYIARLARRWLAGETQAAMARTEGFAGNAAVSERLRRFVAIYQPDLDFGYAVNRRKYIGDALEAYERSRAARVVYGRSTAEEPSGDEIEDSTPLGGRLDIALALRLLKQAVEILTHAPAAQPDWQAQGIGGRAAKRRTGSRLSS